MVNRGYRESFAIRPDLKPNFVPDDTDYRPFIGFNFLESSVLLERGSNHFSNRQIRCMTRAILGQNTKQIAEASRFYGDIIDFDDVQSELGAVYDLLRIPKTKVRQRRRIYLFPACIAGGVMRIDTYGPRDNFLATLNYRPTVLAIAQGMTDGEISSVTDISIGKVKKQIETIGDIVGYRGRELIALGAILTDYVGLEEIWPPPGLQAA